jgi:hypothetical protein
MVNYRFVRVVGVTTIEDCFKYFHSDEQFEFAKDNFFELKDVVWFKVHGIDELIIAQDALEERIRYSERGYYINITNT